jgi:beta-phosphoglucomutase-like phosphatase (HAD superfamily)
MITRLHDGGSASYPDSMSGNGTAPRAVILDLDEALLDSRRAWQYTLEEALVSVTGRRMDVSGLVEEYRRRPWREALSIVIPDARDRQRCETLCGLLYERSGMKKLLVHDGIGMALDELRGRRIEIGAVSRQAHAVAIRQIESTGLERFLSVLAATPAGERWEAPARVQQCLAFLERTPQEAAFVSPDSYDLRDVAERGMRCYNACWCGEAEIAFPGIAEPRSLPRLVT